MSADPIAVSARDLEAEIDFWEWKVWELEAELESARSVRGALVRFGWQIPSWVFAGHVAQPYALGLHEGYPICCIEAFCRDVAAGRLPGLQRGRPSSLDHVPCSECLAKLTDDERRSAERSAEETRRRAECFSSELGALPWTPGSHEAERSS